MLDMSCHGLRVCVSYRAEKRSAPSRGAVVHRPRRTAIDRIRHQHHHGAISRMALGCATVAGPAVEDRIRTAKDCGLHRLQPLHGSTRTASGASSRELAAATGLLGSTRCSRLSTIVRPAGGNQIALVCGYFLVAARLT